MMQVRHRHPEVTGVKYARWSSHGRWHKVSEHHVPTAMRLPGHALDWLVRKCDGLDSNPVQTAKRHLPRGPLCPKPQCFPPVKIK